MSQEKQIDELRGVLWLNPYVRLGSHNAHMLAQYLHNEGYRKQSEGEWNDSVSAFCNKCTVCGAIVERHSVKNKGGKLKFCPNCGAKMKERIEHGQEGNAPGE